MDSQNKQEQALKFVKIKKPITINYEKNNNQKQSNSLQKLDRNTFYNSKHSQDIDEIDLITKEEENIEKLTRMMKSKKLLKLNIKQKSNQTDLMDIEDPLIDKQMEEIEEEDEEEDFDDEDEDNQQTNNKKRYDLQDLQQADKDQYQVCKIINHLLLKNKISQKNAFEIKIPNLLEIQKVDYSQHSSWKFLSSGLGAGARVYGYKVDNTYGDTMKVISKLVRIDAFDDEEINNINNKQQALNKNKKFTFDMDSAIRNSEKAGLKTLELNLDSLNAVLYDLEFDKDPTFWRTSLSFDIKSAETMLLNKLPMDADFGYVVDCEDKIILIVDKQQKEIEKRQENTQNNEYQQLSKIKPWVIRKQGQSVQVIISMYEVLMSQIDEQTINERQQEICDLNVRIDEGEIGRLTLNQEEDRKFISKKPNVIVDYQTLLEQEGGLGDQLQSFEAYIRSEKDPIYSTNKKRWVWENKFYDFVKEQEEQEEEEQRQQIAEEEEEQKQYEKQFEQIMKDQEQQEVNEQDIQIQHNLSIEPKEELEQTEFIEQVNSNNILQEYHQQFGSENPNQENQLNENYSFEVRNAGECDELEIELDSNPNPQMQSQNEINKDNIKSQILDKSQVSLKNVLLPSIQLSKSQSQQNTQNQGSLCFLGPTLFNNEDSNQAFMQLLSFQKNESKKEQLKKQSELQAQQNQQIEVNSSDKEEQQLQVEEDIYISLGNYQWNREEEQLESQNQQESDEQKEQQVKKDDFSQSASKQKQVNQSASENKYQSNTQKENKNKTKKFKESYDCVIPPPIVPTKESIIDFSNIFEQSYIQNQDKLFQQNQTLISEQKNSLLKQTKNQESQNEKSQERKPFQEFNQEQINKKEFHEKDSLNFNLDDDTIYDEFLDQDFDKKRQFKVKKIQLQNLQTIQENDFFYERNTSKNEKKNNSNNEFKYHSQVIAEFFGDDHVEENDKNQEQIEIYMSEEEDDNEQNRFKQQQRNKNSKFTKDDRKKNQECNSDDQEVCIIKHKKINQDLQNVNKIQLSYLNNVLQTQKLKIFENNNQELLIKLDEDEGSSLNLNDLDSVNPFKKGRFEQSQSDEFICEQSFPSYDNICEQFLGQDYKIKKKQQQQEEYLKNYHKQFEQRIEKLQNERKGKELPKKDINKTVLSTLEQNARQCNQEKKQQQNDKNIFNLQKQPLEKENLDQKQLTVQEILQLNNQNICNYNQTIQVEQNLNNIQQQMEVEEEANNIHENDDISDVDIFENYLNFFEKKKKGIFNQIKQKEDQIEEEFNKLLYSDQDSDVDNNEFIFKQMSNQNQQNNGESSAHKGIDFKMDQVYLVDLNLNAEQNHPLYSVKRFLGDQFYQREEELLTDRELKDKKYTWGYYSIPKVDDQLDSFLDSKKFDMKVFNIGKGTHKIDMRQCQKGQQEYFKIKINDEELEELQLIQTSKLSTAPKTKEDWERKKARAIGKRKDLNEIDFNIEEEQENYYQIVQPRYRNLQELKQEQKRRRRSSKKNNFDNLTDDQKIEINLIKKIDILELIKGSISYSNYYELHLRCSDYIHYLELPSLKHFIASKNIYEYFKSQDEALIDINVDEIEIDLDSNPNEDFDKDDFLKAQFQMDGKEIDFNLFECGLYDALEIDRPCFQDILDNTNIPQNTNLTNEKQPIQKESKFQNQNNVINQQKETQIQIENQPSQKDNQSAYNNEAEEERILDQLVASQRTQHLNNLYSESESNMDLSILKSSKKIKKQKKQYFQISNGNSRRRRKYSIDLEEYSNQMLMEDHQEQRICSSELDNNFKQANDQKNQNINYDFRQDEASSFPIYLEDYSVMEFNEESDNQISKQTSLNNEENQNFIMESDQSLQNLESDSSYIQNQPSKKYNPLRSLWLSNKLRSYEKEVKSRFKKSEIEQELKKDHFIQEKNISESRFDIITEHVGQEEEAEQMDSCNSLEEQYNHNEYKHLRPINLDEYELNRVYNPEVKMEWEVKLEYTYQEIREKNPYEDFVYLTPNDILLDTLNENNQYLRSIPYLNNLNNLNRFKSDKFQLKNFHMKSSQMQDKRQIKSNQKISYFQPSISSDFMGMNKKTTMKELIIKIWLFIKQHIKQQDQIQLNEVPFSFYDILLMLPQIIGSQEDAEKISTQNIFSILLHLSNLKNFRLVSNNEGQNFYIFKD